MNLRFKEGQMVKMTGHDDMIVEGAIGIITDVQTEPYVYAIVDDDRDMLSHQRKYFIKLIQL